VTILPAKTKQIVLVIHSTPLQASTKIADSLLANVESLVARLPSCLWGGTKSARRTAAETRP